MTRYLYLFNMETGEEAGHVDISVMQPMDIVAEEARMWADIDDPWCVRDSIND